MSMEAENKIFLKRNRMREVVFPFGILGSRGSRASEPWVIRLLAIPPFHVDHFYNWKEEMLFASKKLLKFFAKTNFPSPNYFHHHTWNIMHTDYIITSCWYLPCTVRNIPDIKRSIWRSRVSWHVSSWTQKWRLIKGTTNACATGARCI